MAYNYLPRMEEYNEIIHKKIHYGQYFNSFGIGSIPTGTTVTMYLISPVNKYMHVTLPEINIDTGQVNMCWCVGSSVTGGIDISVVNVNQSSGITSTIQAIKSSGTLVSLGSTLFKTSIFAGKGITGGMRPNQEYILNKNTLYSLSLYNAYNQTVNYSYQRNWYETSEVYNETREDDL